MFGSIFSYIIIYVMKIECLLIYNFKNTRVKKDNIVHTIRKFYYAKYKHLKTITLPSHVRAEYLNSDATKKYITKSMLILRLFKLLKSA